MLKMAMSKNMQLVKPVIPLLTGDHMKGTVIVKDGAMKKMKKTRKTKKKTLRWRVLIKVQQYLERVKMSRRYMSSMVFPMLE